MDSRTDNEDAEEFSAYSLNTLPGKYKNEEVLLYGIEPDSRYVTIDFNNTKDKNQTKDDSTKEKFTKDMIYMQKIYLRKKVKNQKKKQKENTAGSSIITSCNTLKSFI